MCNRKTKLKGRVRLKWNVKITQTPTEIHNFVWRSRVEVLNCILVRTRPNNNLQTMLTSVILE